jgi:hypothetical protein
MLSGESQVEADAGSNLRARREQATVRRIDFERHNTDGLHARGSERHHYQGRLAQGSLTFPVIPPASPPRCLRKLRLIPTV